MTPRRLILIADDYAISPAVSAGIRSLAERGRLTGTGVMATMPHWPAEAPALAALRGRIEVGLHFTLTDQMPLGTLARLAPTGRLPAIGRLVMASLTGQVPLQEVADELDRQLDRFEAFYGAPPDFIDGHQHVHLLPGIWPIVQSIFERRVDRRFCWVRDCADPHFWRRSSRLKSGVIAGLGRSFSHAAKSRGLLTNRGFSGFYDYQGGSLADYFRAMLVAAEDRHLMMVHPGHVDDALREVDGLTDPREAEYEYLAGEDFLNDLLQSEFTLARPGFLIDAALI